MAILTVFKDSSKITNANEIKKVLNEKGVLFEQWKTEAVLSNDSTQDEILGAYEHELKPFMQEHGFQSADVINVHKQTPNIGAIRSKFLKEHTHSEDEIRFFVDGSGMFFFNFIGDVLGLLCEQGDFISVPKNTKHWFDLAPGYFVKAIRIFSNEEGWVANYTESGKEKDYINA